MADLILFVRCRCRHQFRPVSRQWRRRGPFWLPERAAGQWDGGGGELFGVAGWCQRLLDLAKRVVKTLFLLSFFLSFILSFIPSVIGWLAGWLDESRDSQKVAVGWSAVADASVVVGNGAAPGWVMLYIFFFHWGCNPIFFFWERDY